MNLPGSARSRSLTSSLSTSGSGITIRQLFETDVILTSAFIIAGLAFWTWTDFADARREAEERVSAAALVVEEHAQRSLMAIDMVLESIAELAEERGLDWLHSAAGWQRFRRIANRLPETGVAFVNDPAGRLIAETQSNPPRVVDVSDREWFRLLKDGAEVLHIGRALKGRAGHNFFFPIARAVRGPDGTFQGTVQVGVEVTYIEQLLRNVDIGPGADLGLYRVRDGAVVAKYPITEALLDESVSATPFFSTLAHSQGSSWIGWARIEGQDRIVSARRVSGLPLLVTASSPRDQVYVGAWRRLWWRAAAAAAALAVLCGLTGLALRQAKREASLRAALTTSETRFRQMADNAPVMVWVTEPDGSCSFLSRSWYDFTGQTPETGLGFGRFGAVHEDSRAMAEKVFLAANENREAFRLDYRLRRKDGLYRWAIDAAAPRFGPDGEFLGYIGSVIDITERKEAELALAERNAQLALAGKAALVGSWSLDVETGRMQISEGFAAIHGFPEGTAEITRDEVLACAHPDDRARIDARRSQSFAEQRDEHVSDYRVVRAGGEVRWIESRSYIDYDDAGQARRMVGVNFDVTERKRAEARQSQLIAELDHRVKNSLARVAAVVFSMRETTGSRADFATALEGRIRSMADTHELLSYSRWKGVPLAECVRHFRAR